ncbi:MAG: hypothetical protein J5682_06650 [Prevotella sp.]|nr:hypothetical protein [Prevotella sp.]
MFKTYHSNTEIVINVRKAKSQKMTHIRFEPFTLGGSMFVTDDPDLQEAIERHRDFGTLFTVQVEPPPLLFVGPDGIPEADSADQETANNAHILDFDSMSEAKDYVADTFGVSRTSMRTKEQIETAAAQNGLVIRWKSSAPVMLQRKQLLDFEY